MYSSPNNFLGHHASDHVHVHGFRGTAQNESPSLQRDPFTKELWPYRSENTVSDYNAPYKNEKGMGRKGGFGLGGYRVVECFTEESLRLSGS